MIYGWARGASVGYMVELGTRGASVGYIASWARRGLEKNIWLGLI